MAMITSGLLMTVSAMAVLGMIGIPAIVSAEPNVGTVTVVPLNEEISMEKTVIPMNIPLDNTHPWGAVSGEPSEHVDGYPVVIQFYQGEDLVHTAQVDVADDGSYDYQLRVRNLDALTGEFVHIFAGDYTVHIFRVVPNNNLLV